nr:hypothetical protein B0A51_12704 [Rachicladosporium sp. CCFEE 5018]
MRLLGIVRLLLLGGLGVVAATPDASTSTQPSPSGPYDNVTTPNTTVQPTYFSPVTQITQSDLDVPGAGPSTSTATTTIVASAQTKITQTGLTSEASSAVTKATQTELVTGLTESAATKATQTELAPGVTVLPAQQSQQDLGGAGPPEGVAGASAGPGSGPTDSPSAAPVIVQTSAGVTTTIVQAGGDAGPTGSGGSESPGTTAGSGGASVSGTTSASPQQQTANIAPEIVVPGAALGAVGFLAMLL